jgi:predicted alpha/beta-fold hydrolase
MPHSTPSPPWFLQGPHKQTFGGHYLPGKGIGPPERRYFVPLADGDTLVFHENLPRNWVPGSPLAVLVHGLTGSHRSGTICRLGWLAAEKGLGVIRVDLRGAGDGLALARRPYNGGSSDDLGAMLSQIAKIHPTSPYAVMGVSLGANITLRLAGTLGSAIHEKHPMWKGLVAMNPPVDLAACCALLARPGNRVYEKVFLKALWEAELARRKIHPLPISLSEQMPKTLTEFDNQVTAPIWGFASGMDYYIWGSSVKYLEAIEIPSWILTAKDDPFIDYRSLEPLVGRSTRMQIDIVPHGGHLGYIIWKNGPHRWAEPTAINKLHAMAVS